MTNQEGFKWPKHMPSFPFKKRHKYIHEIALTSNKHPELANILIYTSEPKAKNAERVLGQAINDISVAYNKREVPITVEEGFIT